MAKLSRFIKIIHIVGRYRLDTLVKHRKIPLRYRLLLAPFTLYPSRKESAGQRLRFALESLGPIFIKFGQLLSTRPDLIPYDIIVELAQLQDNVAPFDNGVFRKIVEDSLGNSVEALFESYEHTPLASASVAQVHAAVLKSGDEVIVKAIRPGIEKTISQDVQLMQLIAQLVEIISPEGKRLRPIEVVEDYKTTIFDELELSLEAANASQLRRNFEDSELLYVPKIYWDYTKKNILVMERIYGIPVNNIAEIKAQNTDMHMLAERGVEIFFTQVFEHNFFHADMHPGNVFVSRSNPEKPSYIAVDMAVIGSLTREDQYYLARNLLAMFRRDYRQVAELHVSSGWVPEGTSVSGFESAIRAVCEPIFEKPLKEISFGEALITIFRTAQRYNMPVQPQLVLLQKTLLNIEGLGRQLYPELNLWETAHPFLERWIKTRYHPKTMWKEFTYDAPEWLEKLPQLPHMVFSSYQDIKHLSEMAPKLVETQEQLVKVQKRSRRIRRGAGLIAFICGALLSWPIIDGLSTETMLLWLLAVILLL